MKLDAKRRMAASLLKCGVGRVRFGPAHLHDVKEAITKADLRLLVTDGVVTTKPLAVTSRVRARKIHAQKRKGLRRGSGSRKGSSSRHHKESWMARVRAQRDFIKELKEKGLVAVQTYRQLYRKVKGGFFRSRRHIKLFLDDKRLWQEKKRGK